MFYLLFFSLLISSINCHEVGGELPNDFGSYETPTIDISTSSTDTSTTSTSN